MNFHSALKVQIHWDTSIYVVLSITFVIAVLVVGCARVTPTFPLEVGSISISPSDNMTMVYVPAGEYPMGSEIGLVDEQPVHSVYLDAFCIDQTEVTNAQYSLCVQSDACRQPSVTIYYSEPGYSNHPVVHVSWADAVTYCTWAGRRLPTEAEWEKAASWDPVNNEKRIYPWGNDFDCTKGNFEGSSCDGYAETAPVGSFPSGASSYGALDMGGNVWEWVQDAFQETDPLLGNTENYYAISPSSNPQGVDPSTTVYRVMRGGAWKVNFGFGRSTYRLWFALSDPYDFAGFRCAQDTSP